MPFLPTRQQRDNQISASEFLSLGSYSTFGPQEKLRKGGMSLLLDPAKYRSREGQTERPSLGAKENLSSSVSKWCLPVPFWYLQMFHNKKNKPPLVVICVKHVWTYHILEKNGGISATCDECGGRGCLTTLHLRCGAATWCYSLLGLQTSWRPPTGCLNGADGCENLRFFFSQKTVGCHFFFHRIC